MARSGVVADLSLIPDVLPDSGHFVCLAPVEFDDIWGELVEMIDGSLLVLEVVLLDVSCPRCSRRDSCAMVRKT